MDRGRTRGDGLATVKVDGGCSPIPALPADDAALDLMDEALQIAERSGDDFALANARLALGLALMHRDSPTDRERGLTVLTQLRDMCLHEHFTLSELPIVEAYAAWEQGWRGDLDGASRSQA